ncbi:MAG TPA: metal-dependent hydrolase [Flavitalea sp.]|nr:metal-dependent hydrolase [Flavitalea sp.]
MDTLTHIVLGACVGEVLAEKNIGRKAWIFGALAQSLPDIDAIGSLFLSPSENLLAHRGITHSLFFILMSSFVLAYISRTVLRTTSMNMRQWAFFWGLQSLIHIFLDTFNNYGTGWFEPFYHARYSFNILFVADPFFTLPVLIAAVSFVFIKKQLRRRKWAIGGLTITSLYLLYACINKQLVNATVEKNISSTQYQQGRFLTTPTPLNTWLWYIAVADSNGYRIAHHSVFDHSDSLSFTFFPKLDSLVTNRTEDKDLQRLIVFSQNFYTLEKWGDSLIFNDLRFGQIQGWSNPKGKFVFHYFLHAPAENMMVIQRGRFENFGMKEIRQLVKRIRGN